jgi:1,4-alpha-glucan branching enzyme
MNQERPFVHRSIGARYRNGRCAFTLWAPFSESVVLELDGGARRLPMRRDHWCYWETEEEVAPGSEYRYLLDGTALPIPPPTSSPRGCTVPPGWWTTTPSPGTTRPGAASPSIST